MDICKNCVMDQADPDINFDATGQCNHCSDFYLKHEAFIFSEAEEKTNIEKITNSVRRRSGSSEYDVLIGMSGGVDSSFVCHLVKEMGLNALCLHFDNGWNSDISVSNIRKIVKKCGFELLTVVMDWTEFKDIQRSFFKAGVIDIELITDNAIYALAWKEAKKRKIRSWITGSNYLFEHGMPKSWSWPKQDHKNIRDIYKKFGENKKIKSLPLYGPHTYAAIRTINYGFVKQYKLLDKMNYDASQAKKLLEERYDWREYGSKHEESIFTRFYQSYILVKKFGVDKRKVHLSALIRNKKLLRMEALDILAEDPLNKNTIIRDKDFVLKKLDFSEEEFDAIMLAEPVPHNTYKNLSRTNNFYKKVYSLIS